MSEAQNSQWRASGAYLASSALVPGIPEETKLFLLTYGKTTGTPEDRLEQTRRILLEGGLPQRARASRVTMVNRIQKRLISWNPPQWVLNDLVTFANTEPLDALRASLLLHVCRQDHLLYSVVQTLIIPKWEQGDVLIDISHVQRFLDAATNEHPEIAEWTYITRKKLCSTVLSTLRDYGLLQGTARKRIVEPVVPKFVANHLSHLLRAEGIDSQGIEHHPDWRLWLLTPERTRSLLAGLHHDASAH